MYNIVLGLHIFICCLLIIAVLMQSGKGSDLGSALGGGSGSNFGPSSPASVVNKLTTAIASCFLILSLTLALLSVNRKAESVITKTGSAVEQSTTEQSTQQ